MRFESLNTEHLRVTRCAFDLQGLRVFFEWMIDADWSLSAGNWMWVSSSAFEKALDQPITAHPVRYGKIQDPNGDYVRRWVPELRRMVNFGLISFRLSEKYGEKLNFCV